MKAVITVGIPASGKTTKYKDFDGVVVNRDDIREELYGWPYKFSNKKEQEVTEKQWDMVRGCAEKGLDLAVTDTNLNKGRRDQMKKDLERLGFYVEIDVIECTYELAVKRDLQRDRSVGSDVVWRFFKQWHEQFGIQKADQYHKNVDAWLCDLDGTLAQMKDRSPFDWSKVGEDDVNYLVSHILHLGREAGIEVVFLSGRDSVCYDETRKWLNYWGYKGCKLFMRSEGDQRKDFVVKKELYDTNVKGKYNVLAVFDDRPQVCRLWNLMGLPLMKVGDQSEF